MNPPFYFIKKCVCFPKFLGGSETLVSLLAYGCFCPPCYLTAVGEAEVLCYNQNFKRRSLIGLETCVE